MCIICQAQQDDTLKTFASSTWATFKRAAESRLLLKSNKYQETTTEVNMQEEMPNARYHSKCYKYYAAVSKPSTKSTNKQPMKKPETQHISLMPLSSEKGTLKGSCIFCPLVQKTVSQKEEKLSDCSTHAGCRSVFEAAPRSSNERLKSIVSTLSDWTDLQARVSQYHRSCRLSFFNKLEHHTPQAAESRPASVSSRQIHAKTFLTTSILVDEEVIGKYRPMLVSSIFKL